MMWSTSVLDRTPAFTGIARIQDGIMSADEVVVLRRHQPRLAASCSKHRPPLDKDDMER